MDTIIKKIDKENMTAKDFAEAGEILRNGGLVAFPTETVYGLEQMPLILWQQQKFMRQKGDLQIIH